MLPDAEVLEYRPELISRRGELIAWSGSVMLGLVWLILVISHQRVFVMLPVLFVILFLSASIISLGNWMDRHTLIRLHPDGIEYANGLRHVRLAWTDIQQVRVLPSRWGSKVQVYGERSYFIFHTLGEVRLHGEMKGRMGFEKGEQILRQLILKSELTITDREGEGYYYARE